MWVCICIPPWWINEWPGDPPAGAKLLLLTLLFLEGRWSYLYSRSLVCGIERNGKFQFFSHSLFSTCFWRGDGRLRFRPFPFRKVHRIVLDFYANCLESSCCLMFPLWRIISLATSRFGLGLNPSISYVYTRSSVLSYPIETLWVGARKMASSGLFTITHCTFAWV